jgi:hypothetical protein
MKKIISIFMEGYFYYSTKKNDGTSYASRYILQNILGKRKNYILNLCLITNFKELIKQIIFFLNKKNFFLKIYNIKRYYCNSKFYLNKKKKELFYTIKSKKINLRENNIIFFYKHYTINLLNNIQTDKNLKKIILVHDIYKKTNFQQFKDLKNYSYIFISFYEYKKINFKLSKKFLIIPFNKNFKRIEIKTSENLNYYFISSGGLHDHENLKYLDKILYKKNITLNLVGKICDNINIKQFKTSLILHFYIENLNEIYRSNENIFLIPRIFGSGIPIKFLEAIANNKKCILFGNKKNFGIPFKFISNIIVTKNKNIKEVINNTNYKKIYEKITKYINKNNKLEFKKIQEVIDH